MEGRGLHGTRLPAAGARLPRDVVPLRDADVGPSGAWARGTGCGPASGEDSARTQRVKGAAKA